MIRTLAAAAATATVVVVGAAAPASADDEIGLSRDGVSWVPELTTPLFDDAFVWVPGDVEQESFQVRNDGPSTGEVVVDVLADDPDGLLASEAFTLEARIGSGPWVEVLGGSTTLEPAVLDIAEGARTRVVVRGTFAPETTDHMDELAPFRVRVTLSEDGDIAGEGDSDGGTGGGGNVDGEAGELPDTGSTLGAWLLWAAAGMIGAGLALVRPGRNRQEVSRARA